MLNHQSLREKAERIVKIWGPGVAIDMFPAELLALLDELAEARKMICRVRRHCHLLSRFANASGPIKESGKPISLRKALQVETAGAIELLDEWLTRNAQEEETK